MFNKIKEIIKPDSKESEKNVVGYIHYFFDIDKMESRKTPITEIPPVFRMKSTNEVFALDKVAYYEQGLPVFLIVKGTPFSLEIEKIKDKFAIKGYSAAEIDAKIASIYNIKVFGKGVLQFKDYLVLILTNAITGLVVYILTGLNNIAIANQTIPMGGP